MRLYCDVLETDLVSLTPLRSLMACRGGYREHHPLPYPRHCGVHWLEQMLGYCLFATAMSPFDISADSSSLGIFQRVLIIYIPMRLEDNGLHINKILCFGSIWTPLLYRNGTSNSQQSMRDSLWLKCFMSYHYYNPEEQTISLDGLATSLLLNLQTNLACNDGSWNI